MKSRKRERLEQRRIRYRGITSFSIRGRTDSDGRLIEVTWSGIDEPVLRALLLQHI